MPEVKLNAELRTEFGKGAARRLRRAHKVPAVLYGHGTDPVHISLPGHETLLALRTANALLSIDVDGRSQLALPKLGDYAITASLDVGGQRRLRFTAAPGPQFQPAS